MIVYMRIAVRHQLLGIQAKVDCERGMTHSFAATILPDDSSNGRIKLYDGGLLVVKRTDALYKKFL